MNKKDLTPFIWMVMVIIVLASVSGFNVDESSEAKQQFRFYCSQVKSGYWPDYTNSIHKCE